MSADLRFACQASPSDPASWTALAQRLEAGGFEALSVADHPGTTVSPFVALAAAAPVTTSLGLSTAVLNGGVREPLDVAADAASLSLLSGGRVILGLGAGHTPQEWDAVGRPYPSPADRIARLDDLAHVVRWLLAGEVVDHDGRWFTLRAARLEFAPADPVPLLVGGNSRGTIRVGAEVADIVELGGLGRTLPDGHRHEIRWRPSDIDRIVGAFTDASGPDRSPTLGALVQLVIVTDDAEQAADRLLADLGGAQDPARLPSTADLLGPVPFVLIGTVEEIADQVRASQQRWGFRRFTVREPAIDAVVEVMAALDART